MKLFSEYKVTQLFLYVKLPETEREAAAELQQFSKQTRLECLSNSSQNLLSCHVMVAQTR